MYRVDELNLGRGVNVTLDGEMKIDPASYYRVTCNVYAVGGKRQRRCQRAGQHQIPHVET